MTKETECHVCHTPLIWQNRPFPQLCDWYCPLHAAAPDLLGALTDRAESPQLYAIEWLDTLLRSIRKETLQAERAYDPDAYEHMISTCEDLVKNARAAIAKAEGKE